MEGTQFRHSESGYAMLLVFLMAALIAIALYNEMPRVAFQAQRAKEELLIERGEQYKRAIQLFVRKAGRYPATIEELESLNNTRFLRKRYLDPMTGKEKWRLIHINGGVLTDSIVPKNKPGQVQQPQANTNTFIGEGPVMGAATPASQEQINPAMQRRASDSRPVITQEAPDQPAPADGDQEDSTSDDSDNGDATTAAPGPGMAANQPPTSYPQAPGGFPQPGGYPGQPGYNSALANQQTWVPGVTPNQNSGLGGNAGSPNNAVQNGAQSSGSSVYVAPSLGQSSNQDMVQMERMLHGDFQGPGFPRAQPATFPAQPPGAPPSAFPGQPAGGFAQPGFAGVSTVLTGQNSTLGFSGSPTVGQPPGGLPGIGGTQIGGGIAGVASESTGPAIKVYNERKKYNEWEFVYDKSKDRGLAGVQGNGGVPGTSAQSLGGIPGQIPGQPPGTNGPAGSTGFGGQGGSTFNGLSSGSSGFGQPTSPQLQAPPQPQQPPN